MNFTGTINRCYLMFAIHEWKPPYTWARPQDCRFFMWPTMRFTQHRMRTGCLRSTHSPFDNESSYVGGGVTSASGTVTVVTPTYRVDVILIVVVLVDAGLQTVNT